MNFFSVCIRLFWCWRLPLYVTVFVELYFKNNNKVGSLEPHLIALQHSCGDTSMWAVVQVKSKRLKIGFERKNPCILCLCFCLQYWMLPSGFTSRIISSCVISCLCVNMWLEWVWMSQNEFTLARKTGLHKVSGILYYWGNRFMQLSCMQELLYEFSTLSWNFFI